MMPENYLRKSLWLALLVAAFLLVFSIIPADIYKSNGLRRVNILSDIERKSKSTFKSNKPLYAKGKLSDSATIKDIKCPPSMVCLEDFSSNGNGILHFLSAADSCKRFGRPLRIAFFGDSYIEGDMLVGDFRDSLQQNYGGSGVGFVPAVSEVAGFRITITQSFSKDWEHYSFIDNLNSKIPFGISGNVYIPKNGSYIQFKPVGKRHLSQFKKLHIYYTDAKNDSVIIYIGKKGKKLIVLNDGEGVQSSDIELNTAEQIRIKFTQNGKLKVYGCGFDDDSGVYIDNYAMRGNSGIGLASVKQRIYKQFDEKLHYDLVILQYGLNVANAEYTNYDWYTRSMSKVITHMKTSFPQATILMLGVGDRGGKQDDGSMGTMTGIAELIEAQQKLASDAGICFWNMFDAMGGEGSMAKMVDAKMANKDYTHLTFYGGRKIAHLLAGALLFETKKYQPTKNINP